MESGARPLPPVGMLAPQCAVACAKSDRASA
jgi:hypothetical protein